LYFPGKISPTPKPTTLNPLNRLITADSPTSKGLSKHRRASTSTEIGVKSQSECEMKKKERKKKRRRRRRKYGPCCNSL